MAPHARLAYVPGIAEVELCPSRYLNVRSRWSTAHHRPWWPICRPSCRRLRPFSARAVHQPQPARAPALGAHLRASGRCILITVIKMVPPRRARGVRPILRTIRSIGRFVRARGAFVSNSSTDAPPNGSSARAGRSPWSGQAPSRKRGLR
jgi:hypothetical protein